MKKILTLFAAALCSMSMMAQVADGDYLLQNVESGAYLGGGTNWGTHATLSDEPQWFYLTSQGEGLYTLDSHQYNSETAHYLASGLYCDSGAENWTIGGTSTTGVYTISINGSYLAGATVNGLATLDTEYSNAAQWKLISKADIVASQASASKTNPVDVTAFILNPQLKRNANTSYYPTWTITGFDGTGTPSNFAQGQNGNYADCAESYHSSNGFKASQTISGLKGGIYKLSAQGFYRQDGSVAEYPYIYAGDSKAYLPERTGTENNMVSAYAAFLAGSYKTDAVEAIVNDNGSLEIGVAGSNTSMWNIFGQFRLLYYGEKDYTDYIVNADLSTTDAWDQTETKGISGGQCKISSGKIFDFKQTITLPAGQYKLTAQAAYRYSGSEADEYAAIAAGEETHYMKLYATSGSDNVSVNVKNRWEGASDVALEGTSPVSVNGKYVPNSSADVLTYMKAGYYNNELVFNLGAEGNVTIGINKVENPSVGDYGNIGAWKLERLGDPDPTAAINAALAEAQALVDQKMNKDVNENLITVIAAANAAIESGEDIDATCTALKGVIAEAKASIAVYAKAANVLAKMKELVESTNVYTQEALDAYYTTPAANYEAGLLTNEEASALQDPSQGTGWHASITCDNFLLSAWDTNPDFQDAPYYINTWSVEGDTDGSNFRVPFFEYWTGDANSLGEKTLTATMNNLTPGNYDVSAWARVRLNNNSTDQQATGITFQANDGEAADACVGEQVGDTQFRLMEVKATGVVGEDGVLKIKFNVAAENNISWLSFKNVNYTYVPTQYTLDFSVEGADEMCDEWAVQAGSQRLEYPYEEAYKFDEGTKIYVGGICLDAIHTMTVSVNGQELENEGEYGAYSFSFDLTQNSVIKVVFKDATPASDEVELTQDMFHHWTGVDATAEITADQPYFNGDGLNVSTQMVYGNSNVSELEYADLSEYSKLVITTTEGTPRCLFNRLVANGGTPDNLIDCCNYADHKAAYMTEENGVFTINLAKIVEDKGFAHLLCIKGGNWSNVTVTSMKLVKDGTSTYINNTTTTATKAGKFIENGRVVIMKNGKKYSVAGALLK